MHIIQENISNKSKIFPNICIFAIYIACGYFTAHILKTRCIEVGWKDRNGNDWKSVFENIFHLNNLVYHNLFIPELDNSFFVALSYFLSPCIISRVTTLLHFQHNKNNRIFHLKRNYVSFGLRKNTWNTSFVYKQKVATRTTTTFQVY